MAVNSFKFMSRTLAESMKVWPYVDTGDAAIPWTPLLKPVRECKIALVSSGGFYCAGEEPFDLEHERREPLWGDPSYREIPRGIVQEDIRVAHLHYENSHAVVDFNCVLPLDALEVMLAEESIGAVCDHHLTFMGYQPKPREFMEETLPRMAERLRELGADLVLLSSG
jgi:D-proline reductase (dithiol) PrdB